MSDNILDALSGVVYSNTHDELIDLLDRIQHSDVDPPNSHFSRILGEHMSQYGVLGMKWGVRKDRTKKSTASTEQYSKAKSRTKAKAKAKTKSQNSKTSQNESMSDEDLQKLIRRLQLEQQFAALTAQQKAPPSRVNKLLKDVATDVARGVTTEVGKAILAQALKTQYNRVASPDFQLPAKSRKK